VRAAHRQPIQFSNLKEKPSDAGNDDANKEYRKRTGESPREKLDGHWREVRSGGAI
jgi:hypothetical protein